MTKGFNSGIILIRVVLKLGTGFSYSVWKLYAARVSVVAHVVRAGL